LDDNLFSLFPKIQAMNSEIASLKKFCEGLEAKFLVSNEGSIDSQRGENPLGSQRTPKADIGD
jgi:hypothetical protein